MNKKCFVLLHGGGMSLWVWKDLIPLLKLPSITFNYRLPDNSKEIRRKATIKDCVNHVINTINKNNIEKVILVGHSGAGIIAANLAKAIPDKIHQVIYVCASIPKNNQSALGSLPFILKAINWIAINSQVKIESTPAKKMEKIIRSRFCNTCSEEIIQYVLNQKILSEPLCLAFEKNNWDNFPVINQTYILLTKDKTATVLLQKKMIENLVIQKNVEIDSDHMVMLSHPQELAEILNNTI